MDKGRRNELAKLKQKKRVKNRFNTPFKLDKLHVYKSTGTPCSCHMCSGLKYKRNIKHKNENKD